MLLPWLGARVVGKMSKGPFSENWVWSRPLSDSTLTFYVYTHEKNNNKFRKKGTTLGV